MGYSAATQKSIELRQLFWNAFQAACKDNNLEMAKTRLQDALRAMAFLYGSTHLWPMSPDASLLPGTYQCFADFYLEKANQTKDASILERAEYFLEQSIQAYEEERSTRGTYISALNLYGLYLLWTGRYDEAETIERKRLAVASKQPYGFAGSAFSALGNLYAERNYIQRSDYFYKEAMLRAGLVTDSTPMIAALGNLGRNSVARGAYKDGLSLLQSAAKLSTEISENHGLPGPDQIYDLGEAYLFSGNARKAIDTALPSLKRQEQQSGMRSFRDRELLARAFTEVGDYKNAERMLQIELSQYSLSFPLFLRTVTGLLQDATMLALKTGRLADARNLASQAKETAIRHQGASGDEVAQCLAILAIVQEQGGDHTESRRNIALAIALVLHNHREVQDLTSQNLWWILWRGISILGVDQTADHASTNDSVPFMLAQNLHNGYSVGTALTQMTARLQARSDNLGQMVRRQKAAELGFGQSGEALLGAFSSSTFQLTPEEEKEAHEQWEKGQIATRVLNERHRKVGNLDAIRPPYTLEQFRMYVASKRLQTDFSRTDADLKKISEDIEKEFPKYAELATPRAVSLEETQKTLRSDEALLVYATGNYSDRLVDQEREESFVWLVRSNDWSFRRIPIGKKNLQKQVEKLRAGASVSVGLPFPVDDAYRLYEQLLAPEADRLHGIKTLFIVPDGPLESLPFSLLVTQPLHHSGTPLDYREVAWFSRLYASSTLPTVSSLISLRQLPKAKEVQDPFVGFGNPVLGPSRSAMVANIVPSETTRGGIADASMLRQLPSLPETSEELHQIAKYLNASPSTVYLGSRATVTNVITTSLNKYRIVAFATHGELAGELPGLAEPALVLTPPADSRPMDDGLLRASQVVQLSLNAEWVILSACNTAASDGTVGSPRLSGLAKAFFFAGARSLLVSHWDVPSSPAVAITTRTFNELAEHPEIGRAEALRRSMMYFLDHADRTSTHPMAWAPFVVAGEGSVVP